MKDLFLELLVVLKNFHGDHVKHAFSFPDLGCKVTEIRNVDSQENNKDQNEEHE